MPYHYPPTTVQSSKTSNNCGHLSDNTKLILRKYKQLELIRSIVISDHECILYISNRANTLLEPCEHAGFCAKM